MKDTKLNGLEEPARVVHAYNTPQSIFDGIPVKYRSLLDFDVALIKERYKGKAEEVPCITLHKPYFEVN